MNEKLTISPPYGASASGDAEQDLKSVREARGLSLNDVFHATRVSLVNLEALESGNFKALPPPVYTRNFIRKYARAAGVDEQPLLKRYERYLEGQNPPREEPAVQKPWPEAGRRYRFLFGSLAVVIVAGILVYALILYDQTGRTVPPDPAVEPPPLEQPTPETAVPPTTAESTPQGGETGPPPAATTAPAAVSVKAPPAPPPVTSTAAPVTVTPATPPAAPAAAVPQPAATPVTPRPAAPDKKLTLVVEAREWAWLRITEGRNPSQQVLLKPGEKIERAAADFFLLDIGNAGGINLIFQGKSLGSLGKSGQVIHLRLPERPTEKESP
ncbi:MAG: helix-turn-helix domain-containing protein [Syntrophales bacterium]